MAWRTVATVIIVVFVAVLVWSVTAGPLTTISDSMQPLDNDNNNKLEADNIFPSLESTYFTGFYLFIFGIIAWGFWVIFRDELTQRGGGGGF